MTDRRSCEFEFSNRFTDHIREIVGGRLVDMAKAELDLHEATDMVILRHNEQRLTCRVRRPKYLRAYGHEFTLRASARGARTEAEKILEDGYGDWMFYGFAADNGATCSRVRAWRLIDLHALRTHWRDGDIKNNGAATGVRTNSDGSAFRWFDTREFTALPGWPSIVMYEHGFTAPGKGTTAFVGAKHLAGCQCRQRACREALADAAKDGDEASLRRLVLARFETLLCLRSAVVEVSAQHARVEADGQVLIMQCTPAVLALLSATGRLPAAPSSPAQQWGAPRVRCGPRLHASPANRAAKVAAKVDR